MMISQMYSEEILVLCVDFSKDGFHENSTLIPQLSSMYPSHYIDLTVSESVHK